jgi:hypothetical protein
MIVGLLTLVQSLPKREYLIGLAGFDELATRRVPRQLCPHRKKTLSPG